MNLIVFRALRNSDIISEPSDANVTPITSAGSIEILDASYNCNCEIVRENKCCLLWGGNLIAYNRAKTWCFFRLCWYPLRNDALGATSFQRARPKIFEQFIGLCHGILAKEDLSDATVM